MNLNLSLTLSLVQRSFDNITSGTLSSRQILPNTLLTKLSDVFPMKKWPFYFKLQTCSEHIRNQSDKSCECSVKNVKYASQ